MSLEVYHRFEDSSYTNIYGIGIFSNDKVEIVVTKTVPGELEVCCVTSRLIKLTIGYVSGVVGGTEVAVVTSVSDNYTALFITGHKEPDFDRDSDANFNYVCEVKTITVSLLLPGPGGYNVASVPRRRQHHE